MSKTEPNAINELMEHFTAQAENIKTEMVNADRIGKMVSVYNSAVDALYRIERPSTHRDGPGLLTRLKALKKGAAEKLAEVMKEEGVTAITIDGYTYSVNPVESYSVPKEHKKNLINWLIEIGAGIVKENWSINTDRESFIEWLEKKWKEETGSDTLPISPQERDVDSKTLSSWLKKDWGEFSQQLDEENRELPEFIQRYDGTSIGKRRAASK